MDMKQCIQEWKEFDEARPSLPGEHWMVAGAGAALLLLALKSNGRLTSTLQAMVGGALLFRSASGRDGLRKVWCDPRSAQERANEQALDDYVEQVELGRS